MNEQDHKNNNYSNYHPDNEGVDREDDDGRAPGVPSASNERQPKQQEQQEH